MFPSFFSNLFPNKTLGLYSFSQGVDWACICISQPIYRGNSFLSHMVSLSSDRELLVLEPFFTSGFFLLSSPEQTVKVLCCVAPWRVFNALDTVRRARSIPPTHQQDGAESPAAIFRNIFLTLTLYFRTFPLSSVSLYFLQCAVWFITPSRCVGSVCKIKHDGVCDKYSEHFVTSALLISFSSHGNSF